MVDVSLVPEAAWREARRRAEVIRPLVESAHRSRHLVRAAAATLGLSERHTYRRDVPRRVSRSGHRGIARFSPRTDPEPGRPV
jgi:hypothetical protein